MITYIFGAPGSGKTTTGAYLARKWHKKGRTVYANFPCVNTILMDARDIGQFSFENSVIILDECGIDFNNRDFKKGLMNDPDRLYWFKMHRHYHCDVYVLSQGWDDVDKKIRDLATEYYLIRKALLFRGLTLVRPVFKKCDIDENTHQPTDYFVFGSVFSYKWIVRRKYYADFDSYDRKELPAFVGELTTRGVKRYNVFTRLINALKKIFRRVCYETVRCICSWKETRK